MPTMRYPLGKLPARPDAVELRLRSELARVAAA